MPAPQTGPSAPSVSPPQASDDYLSLWSLRAWSTVSALVSLYATRAMRFQSLQSLRLRRLPCLGERTLAVRVSAPDVLGSWIDGDVFGGCRRGHVAEQQNLAAGGANHGHFVGTGAVNETARRTECDLIHLLHDVDGIGDRSRLGVDDDQLAVAAGREDAVIVRIERQTMGLRGGRRGPPGYDFIGRGIDHRHDVLILDVQVDPIHRFIVDHELRNSRYGDRGNHLG